MTPRSVNDQARSVIKSARDYLQHCHCEHNCGCQDLAADLDALLATMGEPVAWQYWSSDYAEWRNWPEGAGDALKSSLKMRPLYSLPSPREDVPEREAVSAIRNRIERLAAFDVNDSQAGFVRPERAVLFREEVLRVFDQWATRSEEPKR